jgi:hypothetical protein
VTVQSKEGVWNKLGVKGQSASKNLYLQTKLLFQSESTQLYW